MPRIDNKDKSNIIKKLSQSEMSMTGLVSTTGSCILADAASSTGMEEWYLARRAPGCAGVLEKAYERAKEFHDREFKSANSHTWLSTSSSASDVMRILSEAQTRYESKKSVRLKGINTLSSWWRLASSKYGHYPLSHGLCGFE
jgi:hypothetical protein